MLLSWCIRCSAWHSQATPCCPTLKVPGILSPPWRAGPKRPTKVTQARSDRSTPTTTQRKSAFKNYIFEFLYIIIISKFETGDLLQLFSFSRRNSKNMKGLEWTILRFSNIHVGNSIKLTSPWCLTFGLTMVL